MWHEGGRVGVRGRTKWVGGVSVCCLWWGSRSRFCYCCHSWSGLAQIDEQRLVQTTQPSGNDSVLFLSQNFAASLLTMELSSSETSTAASENSASHKAAPSSSSSPSDATAPNSSSAKHFNVKTLQGMCKNFMVQKNKRAYKYSRATKSKLIEYTLELQESKTMNRSLSHN